MGCSIMSVVPAFTAIPGTEKAGLCGYYRSPGVTEVTIAEAITMFRKILYYEDEYIIGEMLITDTGDYTTSAGNCAPVYAIVYNDGWIVTWINKDDSGAEFALSGCGYVTSTQLDGFTGTIEYPQQYNRMIMQIDVSSDSNCPVGTRFTITDCDYINGTVNVAHHQDGYNFSSGHSYGVGIYSDLGNFMWNGYIVSYNNASPPDLSNRLYRAIEEIWNRIYTSSNSPAHTTVHTDAARVYNAATGIWSNYTNIPYSTPLLSTNPIVGSAVYFGSDKKHGGFHVRMNDQGITVGEVKWEYYNGSTWAHLDVTDNTNGFKNHTTYDEITFVPPDDWATHHVNDPNYYYFIRATVITEYDNYPLAAYIYRYSTSYSFGYDDNELGLYAFQYPDAEYINMYGMFKFHGTAYAYVTEFPSTTVYRSIAQHSRYGFAYLIVNGVEVIKYPGSGSTPGYLNTEVDWMFYSSGIQNVFEMYTDSLKNMKLSIMSFTRIS